MKLDMQTVSFILIISKLSVCYKSWFNSSPRSHSFFLTLKFNWNWSIFLCKSFPKQSLSALGKNTFTYPSRQMGKGEKWSHGPTQLWQEGTLSSCKHVLLYIWLVLWILGSLPKSRPSPPLKDRGPQTHGVTRYKSIYFSEQLWSILTKWCGLLPGFQRGTIELIQIEWIQASFFAAHCRPQEKDCFSHLWQYSC